MIAQPSLFDVPKWFDGKTYSPDADQRRLSGQQDAVTRYMLAHDWVTLAELREAIGASETSVSARLRDMRKPRFGGYKVDRRRTDGGLHEYRVTR